MKYQGKRLSVSNSNTQRTSRTRQVHLPIATVLIFLLVAFPLTVYFFVSDVISPCVEFHGEASQTYPVNGKNPYFSNFSRKYKAIEEPTATLFGIDVSSTLKKTGDTIDFNKTGTYHVKYSTFLTSKNYDITINIEDQGKPDICLDGEDDIKIDSIDNYQEAGYTAHDDYDNSTDLTSRVVVTVNQIDENTYEYLYDVKDSAGNSADTVKRVVHILPKENATVNEVSIPEQEKESDNSNTTNVYLTFDDGPSKVTPLILDILKENQVSATFFVVGYKQNSEKDELVKREYSDGHTVALHSFSHAYDVIYQSPDAFMKDLYDIQNSVTNSTGHISYLLRFPGGTSNTVSKKYCSGIMSDLVKRVTDEGFSYVDWNVDSQDASGNNIPKETIAQNVISGIKEGRDNVVLMHDSSTKSTTAEALEDIIKYCKDNGYELKPISELDPVIVHHRVFN